MARRVKIIPPDSPYFTVQQVLGNGSHKSRARPAWASAQRSKQNSQALPAVGGSQRNTRDEAPTPDGAALSHKIAPGMEAVYTITFLPESPDDCRHDLLVCTEREKFIVPLRASGARGALDFPDAVAFGECATKLAAQRTFLVRNVGRCPASFGLLTAAPFDIQPRSGFLGVGESLQCLVRFTPLQQGPTHGELQIEYSEGARASSNIILAQHGTGYCLACHSVA